MIKEKISGTSSISSDDGWITVAQWNNKSELENLPLYSAPDLNVGDEIIVKQHIDTGIPEYGIYGLGLRQIDYDVKCRDSLNSGYEVSIRYRVEELPIETKSIGLIGLIILIASAVVFLVALYYVIKEGAVLLKTAGTAGQILIIAIAGLIGVFSIVYLLRNIKTTG